MHGGFKEENFAWHLLSSFFPNVRMSLKNVRLLGRHGDRPLRKHVGAPSVVARIYFFLHSRMLYKKSPTEPTISILRAGIPIYCETPT